jgi:hypothetical protein
MNKLSKLIGVAITVGLGVAIYNSQIHSIMGWCIALGYFCCFQLNEAQIRKCLDLMDKMRDEK